ncbi:TrkA-N domain protein [[Leptolyngbya] sp. PCC 7376]|uniref:potassium channel family protein n=1 Tax=[Leptolyngbya] sp. PCC 7376 TaxID=111781 RepID=UPI00029F2C4C|nr:potassium channel protein [[Leptolyngbya] sp. PCC 7376]AFY39035.1 TrkA-N domain protein [[Leptolyngbya] sp. PCC 7376]
MYSVEQQYLRLKKQLLLGVFSLLGLCLCGVTWYKLVEQWSLSDAIYMTFISISTVGFGEVRPLDSDRLRFFTITLIVLGVINIGHIVNRFTEAIIGGYVQEWRKLQEQQKRINSLKNHYIVCGLGRTGLQVAQEFTEENIPFVVIDSKPEQIVAARKMGYICIEGDATLDESLYAAKIDDAACLVAALRSDAENLYTVLSAKALKKEIRAVARASTEEGLLKLRRAGADSVVSPYITGGRRLAASALRPQVMDFVDGLFTGSEKSYYLEEVRLDRECGEYIGKTLSQARLRVQSGALVLAIRRSDKGVFKGKLIPGPTGDTILMVDDSLICMGTPDQLRDLNKILLPRGSENQLRPPER